MTSVETVEQLICQRQAGWWAALCRAIPDLEALAGTPQPPEYHAEGDVAVHTRLAIETCPADCDPDLLWVALLHDIGKPTTTEQNGHGRITAYGHAKQGAEMADAILSQLGMPVERQERIVWAVRHHTFHHSWQLEKAEELTRKQSRYLEDPRFPLLLEFLRIDDLASHGNPRGLETYQFYANLLQEISRQKELSP